MPKANDAKTGLARKLTIISGLVILSLGLGVAYVYQQTRVPAKTETSQAPSTSSYTYASTDAQIGSQRYSLLIADTAGKQQLGLGNRKGLADKQGMVFPYASPHKPCFWMKGMQFSIDMIWLDEAKKVTHIEPAVSPETYPDSFCPDAPSQYVVEIPANDSQAIGLKVGDQVSFEL